ncbi:MAG: PIN domain-containing protein [Spirochaetales bacterium]|jgi:predicted nucleic acid-binding protein|nr:PIN domain-containing protein [Spirochaetales bacterium]
MKIGYIDTSFLLSILFEDENYETTIKYWNELDILCSSLLLEIESRINVFKYCILTKNNKSLYKEKEEQLQELLENINKKNIDKEIVLEIKNFDKLKRPKSLDSIHLATANIFNKLLNEKLLLCSYDKNMVKIGKELGMEII